MVVQHNMSAINANRYFGMNNSRLSKSLEKLSSGYQINRAGDNAAGLAVSEKMRSQIAGLTQATKNAQDGISMVQTFEGALTETDNILQRMKTLANQSANGTYDNGVDRAAIQKEFDQLNNELDQIADTDFNGVIVLNGGEMADGTKAVKGKFNYTPTDDIDANTKPLTNGSTTATGTVSNTAVSVSNAFKAGGIDLTYSSSIALQVGARSKDLVNFTFRYAATDGRDHKIDGMGSLKANLDCSSRGLETKNLKLTSQASANYAIDQIDYAINKVSMVRATFGAIQNRLEHKIDNMNTTNENLTAAESRIRDTNMAEEMMAFTKNQILSQASQSMLAQANQLPQGVLSLLQ